MKKPYEQFAEWGRIGGRLGQQRLLKAKRRRPVKAKKRGRRKLPVGPPPSDRAREMNRLYTDEHLTLIQIGARFGLTRERVRQLLKKQGVTGKNGGMFVRTTAKEIAAEKSRRDDRSLRREASCVEWLGCSIDVYEGLTNCVYPSTVSAARRLNTDPCGLFLAQKIHAINDRKIEWNLTFPEWWEIWRK